MYDRKHSCCDCENGEWHNRYRKMSIIIFWGSHGLVIFVDCHVIVSLFIHCNTAKVIKMIQTVINNLKNNERMKG